MIHQIIQGKNPEADLLLYFLIGPLLTDEAIHASLGSPITSRKGDIWYINVDKEGNYRGGFSLVRYSDTEAGKEAHIRYLHVPSSLRKHHIQRILKDAGYDSILTIRAYDYTNSPVWSSLGFDLTKYSNNREAAIWTKTLDPVEYPALYTP